MSDKRAWISIVAGTVLTGGGLGSLIYVKQGDIEESRKLMTEYKLDISKQCRELERELVAGNTTLSISDGVGLALYLRFLKRISAHSRNLISSLVNPVDRIGYAE